LREIKQSDECLITHSIVIESKLAFENGERVRIEKVEPNRLRPEYEYVVLSHKMLTLFQLRREDITPVAVTLESQKVSVQASQKKCASNKPDDESLARALETGKVIGWFGATVIWFIFGSIVCFTEWWWLLAVAAVLGLCWIVFWVVVSSNLEEKWDILGKDSG
jgi:hypothetical protein